jgi:hypothetical protein
MHLTFGESESYRIIWDSRKSQADTGIRRPKGRSPTRLAAAVTGEMTIDPLERKVSETSALPETMPDGKIRSRLVPAVDAIVNSASVLPLPPNYNILYNQSPSTGEHKWIHPAARSRFVRVFGFEQSDDPRIRFTLARERSDRQRTEQGRQKQLPSESSHLPRTEGSRLN